MYFKKNILIVIILIILQCTNAQSQKNDSEFTTKLSKVNEKTKSIYKEYKMYGDFIIGVINEQGLIHSYLLNKEAIEGKKTSLTKDSPFYIASHTKAFTGTLLKIMEDQNQIDLNKTIADYYPELIQDERIDNKSISIKKLLTHTSGFVSAMFQLKTSFLGYQDQGDLLASASNKIMIDPSGRFRYSNTGPILTSMIVEKKFGTSWKNIMKAVVFKRLGMTNTSANVSDFNNNKIRPAVHKNENNGILKTGLYKTDQTMTAAGGVISTLNDLSKWLKVNINQDNVLLSKGAWKDLHEPLVKQNRNYFTYQRHGYSLGWDIATYMKDTILTRFGGWGEISFHASFIPSKKLGIIAYSNDDRAAGLPHLIANYAYNLMNDNVDAEKVFSEEKLIFDKAFKKTIEDLKRIPNNYLSASGFNDEIIGKYKNDEGWPEIIIKKEADYYIINWGVLPGVIYPLNEAQRDYVSPFSGFMGRRFQIKENILKTGSIIYKKQN
ncbi:class C beta-lactamase-related serine hydrolase [Flavobacteriaceae bacterium AU392]|nr:class C beta-lactamase-related serine hydrolase [Flavobacteriaceae bacterium]RKM86056.1 class C beta-lactamase-related serine hydrolase [Flavobacteriaceae bacterium AU392]